MNKSRLISLVAGLILLVVPLVAMGITVGATDNTSGLILIDTDNLTEPAGFFSEGGAGYPLGAEIDNIETTNRLPAHSLAMLVAIISSVGLGLFTYAATSRMKTGVRGSLLIMVAVTEVSLVIWSAGFNVIPGWVLIPMGVWGLVLILWRNPFATPIG